MSRRMSKWLAWPALGYLVVLFALPTLLVMAYSLCRRDFYGGVKWELSLDAWQHAVDVSSLRVITRTLLLAAGVTLLNLVVAYPCAAALARMRPAQRTAWVLLISFPLMTSLLLRTFGWMNLLPLEWRGTLAGVGLVLASNYLPFMVLPLLKAFERAEQGLVPAAFDLGATPWQAFWRVTFPITRSGMLAGSALVFIPASGEYLIPHFIGNGKVEVVGTQVMRQFEQRNWPSAAVSTIWLLVLVLAPMGATLMLAYRRARLFESEGGSA